MIRYVRFRLTSFSGVDYDISVPRQHRNPGQFKLIHPNKSFSFKNITQDVCIFNIIRLTRIFLYEEKALEIYTNKSMIYWIYIDLTNKQILKTLVAWYVTSDIYYMAIY